MDIVRLTNTLEGVIEKLTEELKALNEDNDLATDDMFLDTLENISRDLVGLSDED